MQRHTYYVDPLEYKHVYDMERLKTYNSYAERDIKRLLEGIEKIKHYQLELYAHVQTVLQTDIKKIVVISRRTEGYGSKSKIVYHVQLEYRPDIEEYNRHNYSIKYEHDKRFTGIQRREAIRYAEQLAKEHYTKVEKLGRWE